MNVTLVLGTARKERVSAAIAEAVFSFLTEASNINAQYVDVAEYITQPATIAPWQDHPAAQPWRQVAASSDAFVFVIPEYNHGYPGEWKLLIDQAPKEAYQNKPVLIAGVSAGRLGGARVIEHVQPILSTLGLLYVPSPLSFSDAKTLLDETGTFIDEAYPRRIHRSIEALRSYQQVLTQLSN